MSSLVSRVLSLLNEADVVYSTPPAQNFYVDYYVTTPKGTKGRFQRRAALNQLPSKAHSETAVYFYLKKLHPGTDITIIDLQFVQ